MMCSVYRGGLFTPMICYPISLLSSRPVCGHHHQLPPKPSPWLNSLRNSSSWNPSQGRRQQLVKLSLMQSKYRLHCVCILYLFLQVSFDDVVWFLTVAVWSVINEVNQCQARLVLRWVTDCVRTGKLSRYVTIQLGRLSLPSLPGW